MDVQRLLRDLQDERAARAPVTILLTGEMGTGKDVLANYIHAKSGRRGPLVALNCAGIPEALLDAELFGHERGAFTGATQSRAGLVTAAHGGTLFLDEVGDMPFALQAEILRFLQDGAVRKVVQTDERRVDVRVIAATNRNLDRLGRRHLPPGPAVQARLWALPGRLHHNRGVGLSGGRLLVVTLALGLPVDEAYREGVAGRYGAEASPAKRAIEFLAGALEWVRARGARQGRSEHQTGLRDTSLRPPH